MSDSNNERESFVPRSTPFQPLTPDEKAAKEAENGVRQFDQVLEFVEYGLQADPPPRLRPSTILEWQRLAVDGIEPTAGTYRTSPIQISKARHAPPPPHLVPSLVEEMCDYVNERWTDATPLHLASYILWRLNWIHPFIDGNGRTSRATSYAILCLRLGYLLPGRRAVPDLIADDKFPYYRALEAADEAYERGELDVTKMEQLLSELLAAQLVDIIREAGLEL